MIAGDFTPPTPRPVSKPPPRAPKCTDVASDNLRALLIFPSNSFAGNCLCMRRVEMYIIIVIVYVVSITIFEFVILLIRFFHNFKIYFFITLTCYSSTIIDSI